MKNTLILIHGANAMAGVTKAYVNVEQDEAVERFHDENPHCFGSLEMIDFNDELTLTSFGNKTHVEATHQGLHSLLHSIFG